jgi:Luciferase-like monooxygenase
MSLLEHARRARARRFLRGESRGSWSIAKRWLIRDSWSSCQGQRRGDSPLRIGYKLSSEQFGPVDLARLALIAEDAGFDFAMISDHFHPWTERQGQSPFVWSVLGSISTRTTRLHVGTGVTCPTMRVHPVVIAHAAATVASMFGGRFFLGLGSGENLNEHVIGGSWPKALRERVRRARLRRPDVGEHREDRVPSRLAQLDHERRLCGVRATRGTDGRRHRRPPVDRTPGQTPGTNGTHGIHGRAPVSDLEALQAALAERARAALPWIAPSDRPVRIAGVFAVFATVHEEPGWAWAGAVVMEAGGVLATAEVRGWTCRTCRATLPCSEGRCWRPP